MSPIGTSPFTSEGVDGGKQRGCTYNKKRQEETKDKDEVNSKMKQKQKGKATRPKTTCDNVHWWQRQ